MLFGLLYGAAMGSFRGLVAESQWLLQIAYSAVKVPLLLTATFAISLPSFYVVNTLLGLRRDFAAAVRSLVAAQAGLAIVLASLAPFTLFWYASSQTLPRSPVVQRRDVRGREFYGAMAGARLLPAAGRQESAASAGAVVLAGRLHAGRNSNGVAAAAVHRLAG